MVLAKISATLHLRVEYSFDFELRHLGVTILVSTSHVGAVKSVMLRCYCCLNVALIDFYLSFGFSMFSDSIRFEVAIGMATMVKLVRVSKNKPISSSCKFRMIGALVWSVATYGCEAWTLKQGQENRIQAFASKYVRKTCRGKARSRKSENILD